MAVKNHTQLADLMGVRTDEGIIIGALESHVLTPKSVANYPPFVPFTQTGLTPPPPPMHS